VSLGQVVQEWSGVLEADISGDAWELQMAFSNIDTNAPDGLMGDTTIELVVTVYPPDAL
jgi:hypothetical protein